MPRVRHLADDYKIFQRYYKDPGLEPLTDRSRRPFRQANELPVQIETLIVQLKREHPGWGHSRSPRSCADATMTYRRRP